MRPLHTSLSVKRDGEAADGGCVDEYPGFAPPGEKVWDELYTISQKISSSSSPLLASFLSVTHLLPYWHLVSPINFLCLELCFSVTSERPTPLYQKLQAKISCSSLRPSQNRAFSKDAFWEKNPFPKELKHLLFNSFTVTGFTEDSVRFLLYLPVLIGEKNNVSGEMS